MKELHGKPLLSGARLLSPAGEAGSQLIPEGGTKMPAKSLPGQSSFSLHRRIPIYAGTVLGEARAAFVDAASSVGSHCVNSPIVPCCQNCTSGKVDEVSGKEKTATGKEGKEREMLTRTKEAVLRIFAFYKDEEGQALAEYGLILGLIAVVAIAALTLLGGAITGKLDVVNSALGGGGSA
jgi:pilus assembly protein Flp/PilA